MLSRRDANVEVLERQRFSVFEEQKGEQCLEQAAGEAWVQEVRW